MEAAVWILVFIVSLAVLIKGADYFVAAAEKIGAALGLPPFVIGVVIVGFGTSLPELVASILSVVDGHSEIVVGNVLGSNIANIFLVLGAAVVIGNDFRIKYNLLKADLPMLVGASALLTFMIWDMKFSMGEAILCMVCLLIYFAAALKTSSDEEAETPKVGAKNILLLLISGTMIYFGGKYTIDAIVAISKLLDIGKEVIALSAVALGTSLPELFVAIAAIKKGKPEMAVGNVIGSNIFNTFGVMGVASFFGNLEIPADIISFSLPVSIAATTMCVVITVDRKISRMEGCLLLVFYAYFIGSIYGLL